MVDAEGEACEISDASGYSPIISSERCGKGAAVETQRNVARSYNAITSAKRRFHY
jgi:hypothetical protein